MHVLLLLISDQHIPNLLSVHHYKPDRIVLVVTNEMAAKKTDINFLRALKESCNPAMDYHERHERIDIADASSFAAIRDAYRNAFYLYPDAQWTCNITGGNKPMSIFAYEYFKSKNARIVYIEINRPDVIMNLNTNEQEICTYRPSINEFIAGYGHINKKPSEVIKRYEDLADTWWECSRTIAEHSTGKNFLKLDDKRWEQCREKGIFLQNNDLIIKEDSVRDVVAKTFSFTVNENCLLGKICKEAGVYLTGDWLGSFFWKLLKIHKNALDIWDIHLGIEPATSEGLARNDFDVAFMRRHQLCMIECKTGSQQYDPKVDVVYKIDSVIQRFHALGAKAYLATTSDNVYDNKEVLKKHIKERASSLRLTIIDRLKIQQLAGNPDNVELVRKIFCWDLEGVDPEQTMNSKFNPYKHYLKIDP
jgi:hypothetical protein